VSERARQRAIYPCPVLIPLHATRRPYRTERPSYATRGRVQRDRRERENENRAASETD
jgi:hypothetical protein